jgi:hypothetical protein
VLPSFILLGITGEPLGVVDVLLASKPPDGTIVWSYINRYDADRVAAVNGAARYPESFADFDRSGCS